MRRLSVLLLAVLLTAASHAQSRQDRSELPVPPHPFDRPVQFDNLSVEDGLSQGSVYAIHQDRQGFMWFGTQGGISRYDGYTFRNFSHVPFDSASAAPAWVQDIAEDAGGALWLANTYGGLSRMDPATERFTHFIHDGTDSTSLLQGWVSAVHVDRDGIIWVGVRNGGLDRMDPERPGLFEHFVHDPDDPSSLSSNAMFSIYEDRTGDLWISTNNGLNRMRRSEPGRFVRYLYDPSRADVVLRGFDQSRIAGLYERSDEPGILWVGTVGGLMKLDIESGHTRNVYPHPTSQIAADPDDEDILWLTTRTEGLVRFDIASETGIQFRNDPADPQSLSGDNTWSVTSDRSGTVWVGTNPTGISKFNPSAVSFAHIRYDPKNPNGLAEPGSWGLLVDRDGGLWVAGALRGILQRIDLPTGRAERWIADPARPEDPTRPAGRPGVLAEDPDGSIWIGTTEGVNRFDPRSRRFDLYRHDSDDPHSLSSNVTDIVRVDRSGAIWVGTRGQGIDRLDRKTGRFTHFRHDPADTTTLGSPRVLFLLEDHAGIFWFGGTGLDWMNPNGPGRFNRIVHDPRKPKGITNGSVMWIHERSKEPGVLWLATLGGGLDRMDVRTQTFTHYTEQNSDLPSNGIYAILEDEEGRLWMSTNLGITRFDPETQTFSNYGLEHGLQSLEFNSWSATRAADGQMFFGGVNGINSFYPEAVGFSELPPPVALTDLRLFNVPVEPGPDSPLREALSKTSRIELAFDQARNVGLDFVALHFKNSERNRYAYRLEGFDPDWIDAGQQRSATYTNLPPGEYTFRVKAANSDGIWNEEGARLQIVVLPPWWRTTWAYIIYGMLFIGGIVAVDRIQRRRLLKRALLEQAELRARAAESEKDAAEAKAHAIEADFERKKDAELLGEIGQELTSTLDLETIFNRVYEHVNKLVEAPIFGIGLYDAEHSQIHYRLAIENGKRYEPYTRNATDKNQFPVWCIEHGEPVFVNDVEKEYSRYIQSYSHQEWQLEDGSVARNPQSLIYLPLISKDRALGVLSVQSFRQNAYTEHDLNILRTLATHTAIAIDNADAYRNLNTTLEHLREAQQQLVQQEKLASLGQLTAGIAHEIKNPLNFITNFSALNEELSSEAVAALASCRESPSEEKYGELDDLLTSLRLNAGHVAKHGRRADRIVKSMMEHASGGHGERYPVDVNAFLEEYMNLAYHGRRAQMPGFEVVLERHFDDDVGTVEMAPQELGRVVVNLLSNAFDAVNEKRIRSEGDYTPCVAVRTRRQNGQIEIQVEDNGPGIAGEIRGKIFEPFFTTKPAGSGTGLGLSLSYDIVTHGHGGKLTVASGDEAGTVFTIALPLKST